MLESYYKLMGVPWWDRKALDLGHSVRADERKQEDATYSSREVRMAVVHTREDVILLASLLSSVNRQLSWIVALLAIILATLGYIAIRLT